MKKKLFSLLLMLALVLSLGTVAYANSTTIPGGTVTYTSSKTMTNTFNDKEANDALSKLRPGDDATAVVTIKNENSVTTEWYYSSSIFESLEDAAEDENRGAHGGGYTYRLTYSGPGGTYTLFDSENLGGTDTSGGEGLHQAVGGLENFNYLDTLAYGQSGTVTLYVKIDGLAQHNDYQDTQAQFDLQFGVLPREDLPEGETPNPQKLIKTGDENNVGLYVGLTAVSGLFVLLLALYGWSSNRKNRKVKKEEGQK